VSTSSLTDARTNFSEIVDHVVSTGDEWTVTRHGRPVAVVIAFDEYESMIETLNILSDADTMDAIAEGQADLG
jgi:prevent-host-death family protein